MFPFRSEETSSFTVNSKSGTLTRAGNKFHEVEDVNKDISHFIRQPFYGVPALGTVTTSLSHLDRIMTPGKALTFPPFFSKQVHTCARKHTLKATSIAHLDFFFSLPDCLAKASNSRFVLTPEDTTRTAKHNQRRRQ